MTASGVQNLPGFQCPGKSLAVDAGSQSGLSHLVFFLLRSRSPHCKPVLFHNISPSSVVSLLHRMAMDYAGGWMSFDTFHGHLSAHQRYPFHLAFQIVSSVKMHQFPVTAHQIQIHGSSFCQHDRIGSLIYEFYATVIISLSSYYTVV